jgi:hypothetical protein
MATSKVKITFPKPNFVLKTGTLLVASGRADVSILSVQGECRPRSGTGPNIKGTMTSYYLVPGKNSQPSFYRWIIGFRGLDLVEYDLTVTGNEGSHDTVPFIVAKLAEHARKALSATGPSRREEPYDPFFSIDYPQTNDPITDEEDDFVAWGECVGLEMDPDNTWLEDTYDNPVPTQQTFSDAQALQFWSVSFAPIPHPEVYSFHSENTEGTGYTHDNLNAS